MGEKAGLAPAFLLAWLFPSRIAPARQPHPQQTVDGLQAALEIGARSSYVLSAPTLASDPGSSPAMRAPTRRGPRAWNACYG
jgi:hypothetical protein